MDQDSTTPIIVQKSEQGMADLQNNFKGFSFGKILPKLIFIVLGLVIVAEVVFGIKTLTKTTFASKLNGIGGGQIVLVSGQKSFQAGDDIRVLIRENTGGHNTVGSDVILKYDPKYLEATGSANFYKGKIYNQFPIIQVATRSGEIRVSATIPPGGKGFEGIGIFGGVRFKALQNGNTSVSVELTKGSTSTSTIVEANTARNVLASVSNLNLSIGSSANQTAQANACFPRFQQQCTDSMGRIGSQWCTSTLDNPSICTSGCYIDRTSNIAGCSVVVVPSKK